LLGTCGAGGIFQHGGGRREGERVGGISADRKSSGSSGDVSGSAVFEMHLLEERRAVTDWQNVFGCEVSNSHHDEWDLGKDWNFWVRRLQFNDAREVVH
jgi:hypothetical protein